MYRVTDAQTDYILNDIRQRGVEMEDLQNNLLDHICCMLEQKCKSEKDFETEYQNIIRQFFKHELWEIEEETILLLKYKHYYKMKRFLYILLFLSVSYNIYVFSRIGYSVYQERKMMQTMMRVNNASFEEGYEHLVPVLRKEHPEVLKKKYLCIYFPGDPRSDYEKELFHNPYADDSTGARKQKMFHYRNLYQIDSIAGVTENVGFVFAYKKNDPAVEKEMRVNKYVFKNAVFVDDQFKLFSGFCNNNKDRFGYVSNLFVMDSNGKQLYYSKYPVSESVFLSRFLKTLPKH